MNLSIQNTINNTNYNMIRTSKMTFKGYHLKPEAFTAEREIVEKIRTMPDKIFKEQAEFLKFCKSIDITPKISRVIKNKLAEVWQYNLTGQKCKNSPVYLKSINLPHSP